MGTYEEDLKRAQDHAERVKQKREIKEIYHSNDIKRKPLAFSKVAFIVIFLDCLLIQCFSMFFMWMYPEASDIGALIGIAIALIGEVAACTSYNRKSTIENSAGGIVYEAYMKSREELSDDEINNAVG